MGKQLEKKIRALEIYKREISDWPHARTIAAVSALASFRGANIGVSSVETFVLMSNIQY